MKEGLFIAVIAIVGSLYFAGTTISPQAKKVAYTPVKVKWWQQFIKYHTVEEIIDAAYDAGYVYRSVNCSKDPSYSGYTNMTALEKDMYFRIHSLGKTETQRCHIAHNIGDYLIKT